MGNLLYLALAAGLSTLGVLVLWLVRHRPRSMQSGIDAFSRELQALAPPEARAARSEIHLGGVQPLPARPRHARRGRAAVPTAVATSAEPALPAGVGGVGRTGERSAGRDGE